MCQIAQPNEPAINPKNQINESTQPTHIDIHQYGNGTWKRRRIQSVAQLLADGATVPFIARYRKEATGSLDEVAVSAIRDRLTQLQELDSRRETILKSLEQHGHLTDGSQRPGAGRRTMTRLEDIYLPYRPKRRTKATIAREKGLEPLALAFWPKRERIRSRWPAAMWTLNKGWIPSKRPCPARGTSLPKHQRRPAGPSRVRDLFFEKADIRSQVVAGKESDWGQIQRLFSVGGTRGDGPVPPDPGHASRREGGDTEPVHHAATGTGHRHIGGSVRHR
jgi:transcriptional accessory protein Tex/SPT6